MANTTYEELWDAFEPIANFDDYDLPTTVDGRRKLINAAVKIYNQVLFTEIECDNVLDEISEKLEDKYINLLVNCMRLQVCRNIYSEFTTTYSMYKNEIGFKDYKAQIDGRQFLIDDQERIVNKIVFSLNEDY